MSALSQVHESLDHRTEWKLTMYNMNVFYVNILREFGSIPEQEHKRL